jgi:hypothetical protein
MGPLPGRNILLTADVETYDARGCLACAGLIESQIHLDRSRIVMNVSALFTKNAASADCGRKPNSALHPKLKGASGCHKTFFA